MELLREVGYPWTAINAGSCREGPGASSSFWGELMGEGKKLKGKS